MTFDPYSAADNRLIFGFLIVRNLFTLWFLMRRRDPHACQRQAEEVELLE